jgi:hypothetical protein
MGHGKIRSRIKRDAMPGRAAMRRSEASPLNKSVEHFF